jgi:hypothetical protein
MPAELVFVISAIGIVAFSIKILASGVIIYGDIAGLLYFILINLFALMPFYVNGYSRTEAEIISLPLLAMSVTMIFAFRAEDDVYREF